VIEQSRSDLVLYVNRAVAKPTVQNAAPEIDAAILCLGLGVGLLSVGAGAFIGAVTVDVDRAVEIEDRMYKVKVASGEIDPEQGEKKRTSKPPRLSGTSPPAPSQVTDSRMAATDNTLERSATN
jgi:hypothetical protein